MDRTHLENADRIGEFLRQQASGEEGQIKLWVTFDSQGGIIGLGRVGQDEPRKAQHFAVDATRWREGLPAVSVISGPSLLGRLFGGKVDLSYLNTPQLMQQVQVAHRAVLQRAQRQKRRGPPRRAVPIPFRVPDQQPSRRLFGSQRAAPKAMLQGGINVLSLPGLAAGQGEFAVGLYADKAVVAMGPGSAKLVEGMEKLLIVPEMLGNSEHVATALRGVAGGEPVIGGLVSRTDEGYLFQFAKAPGLFAYKRGVDGSVTSVTRRGEEVQQQLLQEGEIVILLKKPDGGRLPTPHHVARALEGTQSVEQVKEALVPLTGSVLAYKASDVEQYAVPKAYAKQLHDERIAYALRCGVRFLDAHVAEVGLFRITGSKGDVDKALQEIRAGADPFEVMERLDPKGNRPHEVANLMTRLVREQRSTPPLSLAFREGFKAATDPAAFARDQLAGQPAMKELLVFLKRLVENPDNKMEVPQLAIVWGPNLTGDPFEGAGVVASLIEMADQINLGE